MTSTKLKLVDLFAGTGAFSYVSHKTNKIETIFSNDILDSSKEIYDINNNFELLLKDLNDINIEEIPKFDILTAGFPCQPFSIAGKQLGFEDKRSNVFWKIIEIIDYHKPKIIILENVKNLITHDNKNTFKTIIKSLEEINYHIKYQIINTCDYSIIPQNRERIYIVGFNDIKDYNKFDFNFDKIKNNNLSSFIEDTEINKKYYYDSKSKIYNCLQENISKSINDNVIYQYRRYYVRENKKGRCPTLTANMGSGGHNVPIILDKNGIRKLTPRECFNLQGFPNDYILPKISDNKLYSLAGNAVSIPIITLIINKICETIFKDFS
jgi:DNA (cytosine-5)-methyltransferase 1